MLDDFSSRQEIERLLSFTKQTKGTREKSRLCHDWTQSGVCRYGTSCRFQHDSQHAYTPLSYHNRLWSHEQEKSGQAMSAKERNGSAGQNFASRLSQVVGQSSSEASRKTENASNNGQPKKEWNFSLMSYNILADKLAHEHARELYRAVPPFCLDWSHRAAHILEELKFWNPDVICLQEVDHADTFIQKLEPAGYEYALAPRTGDRTDGCMTFWKRSKFASVRHDVLEMAQHNLKDNVALFVTLVPEGDHLSDALAQPAHNISPQDMFRARGPPFVVANTHLLFNPKRGDIKLGQSRLILNKIVEICKHINMPPAAIFCGDFNSKPKSAIYSFVNEGELDCFMEDRRILSGQLESEEKGWPSHGRPSPAQFLRMRPRGGSMDSPGNPFLLARDNGMQATSPPHHVASLPAMAYLNSSLKTPTTPPAERPMRVGESFTNLGSPMEELRGASLDDPRRSGPVCLPGQAPMYAHTDKFGQVAWSRVPPTHGQFKRQPFYHEPMVVEEASPPAPPPPPAGIVRTVSFADRQMNAQTWTVEQLMVATGLHLENGNLPDINGNVKTQLPPPSATDLWIAEHPLPMKSSYATLLGGEPEYTTCHGKFIGTVDYVWFTPEAGPVKLKPKRALLPPPLESLHCGLPSPEWPSDHISLLVEFCLSVDTQDN